MKSRMLFSSWPVQAERLRWVVDVTVLEASPAPTCVIRALLLVVRKGSRWPVAGQDEQCRFPKFLLAAMQLCVQRGVRQPYGRSLVSKYGAPLADMPHCLLTSFASAV